MIRTRHLIFLPLIQQDGADQDAAATTPETAVDGAEQGGRPKSRPTIVLVHGAWADGTGWQEVIKRLEREGYPVIAVQNPLTSLVDRYLDSRELWNYW